jgi:glycosyltransferase involved in cell wall biosynthesis
MGGSMVTVLMAVRDTPVALLRQAIESIRGQSWRDFEFLILDDGSRNRETLGELERQRAADPRIRWRTGAPAGLTKALARGLALATRELVARQDADDWSDPERLELQVAFLRAHPRWALCGSNAWTHRHDGRRLWPTRLPETADEIETAFWRQNPFVHGATMFRAAAARAVGGYREEFLCGQDYDFFWRLADAYGAANLPQPLYHYRYSRCAVSAQRAVEQARAWRAAQILAAARRDAIPEDVARALALAEETVQTRREGLRAALKQADHRLLAGDTWGAGRSYGALLASHPGNLRTWGKLARWALFSSLPASREMCFR